MADERDKEDFTQVLILVDNLLWRTRKYNELVDCRIKTERDLLDKYMRKIEIAYEHYKAKTEGGDD